MLGHVTHGEETVKYLVRLDTGVYSLHPSQIAKRLQILFTNHRLEPFQRHENSDEFIEDFLMYKKIFKV